jgi:hypothetical protein
MLLATEFDLPFVQHRVGRADSKLALDAYHRLLDRSKRAPGEAFDTLVADARTTLFGAGDGDFAPLSCPPVDFGGFDEDRAARDMPGNIGDSVHGRGGFRTCDLSRVKRALSH